MLRLFSALLTASGLLCGCSMLNSESIPEGAAISVTGDTTCHSEAGAYYLPKAFFRVVVNADRKTKTVFLDRVQVNYRPDRTQGYCLDYASSPTAHDLVKVFKAKAGPKFIKKNGETIEEPGSEFAASGSDLLQAISTDAIDESAFIAKAIIRTIFVGLTGNPGFDTSGTAIGRSLSGVVGPDEARVLDIEYDPFNLAQAALINQSLSELGFCIVVQGITIGRRGETLSSYCDDPVRSVERQLQFANTLLAAQTPSKVPSARGILYRPRLPYTVLLLVKSNKKARGGWQIRGTEVAELENISPILSIRVDRAFFANRKTTLMFDHGALLNICIAKTSELKTLVEVPLEIAASIVAVPANLIQVRIDQTKGRETLLQAERQLIQAQIQQLKLEQAVTQEEINALSQGANPTSTKIAGQKLQYETLGQTLEQQLAEGRAQYNGIYDEFGAGGICPDARLVPTIAGAVDD